MNLQPGDGSIETRRPVSAVLAVTNDLSVYQRTSALPLAEKS